MASRLFSVHVLDIVRRRVSDAIPDIRADESMVVQRVDGGDLIALAARVGVHPLILPLSKVPAIDRLATARRLRRFRSRLAKGHVAYVATKGDDVAGWMWSSNTRLYRDRWIGLKLHLEADEGYLYDFWVSPAFRRSGVGAFITAETLRDLQCDGRMQWVYGWIDRDNKPNQMLLRVVFGFESVQSVKCMRVLVAFARVLPRSATPREGPCARTRVRSW